MGFELAEVAIVFGCLLPGLHTAYTDIKKRLVYDVVTLPIFLAGFIFAVINHSYTNAFIGCSLGFISLFVAAWITNGAIGGGDIKLAAGIGIWFGYPATVAVIVSACLAATLYEFLRYWKLGALDKLFRERLGPYARKIILRLGCQLKGIDLSVSAKYAAIPFAPFLICSSWLVWIIMMKGGI